MQYNISPWVGRTVLINMLLLLMMGSLPQLMYAQTTFYKSIDINNDITLASQVLVMNENYGVVGLETCEGVRCLMWLLVNTDGLVVFDTVYSNGIYDFSPTSQGSYFTNGIQHYLTGNISSLETRNDIFVMQFNPFTGDSIWLRTYGEELDDLSTKLTGVENQQMLLYGSRVLQQDQINRAIITTWLLKLDTLGTIIWEQDIGIEDALNVKLNHCIMASGDYLTVYGSCEPWNDDCNGFTGYGLYATKIDTSGQEIWTRELRRATRLAWSNSTLVLLNDGLIVLNFVNDTLPLPADSFRFQPMLLWLDEQGDVVREFNFKRDRRRYVNSLTKAANGDIIGAGSIDLSEEDLGVAGWVFRMTSQGDLLWERFLADVRFPINLHRFNDVIEANDGGIVLTGLLQDSFPNHDPTINNPNIWLVKLDSTGCLEPDCGAFQVMGAVVNTESPISLPQSPILHLFPNPASHYFQLRWLEENASSYPLVVRIYDMYGKLVLEDDFQKSPLVISLEGWSKGIYIVNAENKNGQIRTQKLIVD